MSLCISFICVVRFMYFWTSQYIYVLVVCFVQECYNNT